MRLDSRAVTMLVPIGAESECTGCTRLMTFIPLGKEKWVIANVYVGRGKTRKWDRLEKWHPTCYRSAGKPYGDAPLRKAQISKRTSW
jgi:hypothetical protein